MAWIVLIFGAAGFIFLMLNMPFIQEAAIIGENLTAYTANTTHWVGFTETMGFIPLSLIFFSIGIGIYGWWRATNR